MCGFKIVVQLTSPDQRKKHSEGHFKPSLIYGSAEVQNERYPRWQTI
jgi:hypothetical protein